MAFPKHKTTITRQSFNSSQISLMADDYESSDNNLDNRDPMRYKVESNEHARWTELKF
jgi:hypothetical protein